ncbi:hypothetical protein MSG28_012354 [Choristoneura fumiferana]|uniref:Uncharacterized protein n=1 Tax=Choristoneura fumiferana TaxID=7141 RepID=A0ACC0KD77_CHOFU|nr:hypothetical protein MSG28_012354 [Choristoneura fumiferana]
MYGKNTANHYSSATVSQASRVLLAKYLTVSPNIMRDEVRAAIKHLKCNKAMGCDEIPIEVFKAMGESGVDVLFTICNKIWETGIWPDDWSQSIFIPLHKKGSTKKSIGEIFEKI